ncbi:MAG: cytidylate kinase-like family protein [Oscillospiraceae bacterium]|nr:cytidylate kinase-like family protein [Oscillospiraceae bacterium]
MRIITISRQFGSGGRELGKRLADRLGWDYYDKEIIDTLAAEHGLDPEYVKRALSNHGWHNVQLSYRNSFSNLLYHPGASTQLLCREREVLKSIAALGNDCIIIGRDADVILEDYHPFRIYVCAETQARLARCMKHEASRPQEERLTEKQILRNIRKIDKNRSSTREIISGRPCDDCSAFELIVNTTGWEIKKLTAAVGDFAMQWFEG